MINYSDSGLKRWWMNIFIFMVIFYCSASIASEEKTTIVTVVIENKAPTCSMLIGNRQSAYTYNLGELKQGTTVHPELGIKVVCDSEAPIGVKAGVMKGTLLPGLDSLLSMHIDGHRPAGDPFVLGLKDGNTGNRIQLSGDNIFCSGVASPSNFMSCTLRPETIIKASPTKGNVNASIKFTAVYN